MITREDIETATKVLTKCGTKDLWFPNAGETTILSWAESFAESGLSCADLLAGVERAYRNEDAPFRPLPSSLIKHAQLAYTEALQGLSKEDREAMEEASVVLQDLGIAPPAAHKWVRAVKTGRPKPFELTAEQERTFKQRYAERRQLQADPERARTLMAQIGSRM